MTMLFLVEGGNADRATGTVSLAAPVVPGTSVANWKRRRALVLASMLFPPGGSGGRRCSTGTAEAAFRTVPGASPWIGRPGRADTPPLSSSIVLTPLRFANERNGCDRCLDDWFGEGQVFSPNESSGAGRNARRQKRGARRPRSFSRKEGEGAAGDSSLAPPPPPMRREGNRKSIPRRAVAHVSTPTRAEAAVRAGYIIRESPGSDEEGVTQGFIVMETKRRRQPQRQQKFLPFRRISIVRRRFDGEREQEGAERKLPQVLRIVDTGASGLAAGDDKRKVELRSGSPPRISQPRRHPSRGGRRRIWMGGDREKPPVDGSDVEDGGRQTRKRQSRVVFKATREASRAIALPTAATAAMLTNYMTQPVERYSLLSFHDDGSFRPSPLFDDDGRRSGNPSQKRRWLVRRLTSEEARPYVARESSPHSDRPSSFSGEGCLLDESNLFRLAVPLQPLIGWDLTPVIDLEVIPPTLGAINEVISTKREEGKHASTSEFSFSSRWKPLRGIRQRYGNGGDRGPNADNPDGTSQPLLQVRSLRVSLLSTQEEVRSMMDEGGNRRARNDGKAKGKRNLAVERGSNRRRDAQTSVVSAPPASMQEEALGMVGKVEEWLRPHITFEAEISWNDASLLDSVAYAYSPVESAASTDSVGGNTAATAWGNTDDVTSIAAATKPSTVSIRSTAITSLTVPELPVGMATATPSAFLVKRLGATLTSKALEICLPRFLRHLERDFERWSKKTEE